AGDQADLSPVALVRVVGREQQQELALERVGVLELVDEEMREASLELGARFGVVTDEIAREGEQIEEVEHATTSLQRFVAGDHALQLELEPRGELFVAFAEHVGEERARVVTR